MENGGDFHKDEVMRLRLVLAVSTASIALAAPAHADPDADFLGALKIAGITYKSGPDAVSTGRQACQLMDQGHSESEVVKSMTQDNKGFATDAATTFTRLAEKNFCPEHIPPPAPPPWQPPIDFPLPPLPAAL